MGAASRSRWLRGVSRKVRVWPRSQARRRKGRCNDDWRWQCEASLVRVGPELDAHFGQCWMFVVIAAFASFDTFAEALTALPQPLRQTRLQAGRRRYAT